MIKRTIILLLFTCACVCSQAQVAIITTIAGTGAGSFGGDGGPATNAKLYYPTGVCLDRDGNIFLADGVNQRIRRIDGATGIITTVAGNGIAGYNGDNIPATDAKLNAPCDVYTDTSGNVYIADGLNNRIRKITTSSGLITTVAGTGVIGSSGDGGMATNAELSGPVGVCLDNTGNIYIADYDNNKVRKIDIVSGIISTIAGNGTAAYNGDGIPAISAEINGAIQVAADDSGNVFICDQWNHRVRKVNKNTGIITTIAGNGVSGYSGNDSAATNAKINQPSGICFDKHGNIFLAEYGNGTIRKIDAVSGIISLIAGTGTRGFSGDGGPATAAKLRCADVFLDTFGSVYIADYENNRIRIVYNPQLDVPSQNVSTSQVRVYPNPATNVLTIEYKLPNNEEAIMQIIDIMGRLVITKNLSSQKQPFGKLTMTLNISSLSQGVYLYKVVQNGGAISTGRIIKE